MSPNVIEQLTKLATSGETPVFMTGQEGQELVEAGFATPDPSQPGTVPGSCRVSLTQAGWDYFQAMQQQTPTPTAPAAKPAVSGVTVGVPLPAPRKRGGANNLVPRESIYPFDELAEPTIDPASGQPLYASFHVGCTPEKPEPWKAMASNVSAANKRSEVEVKDEAGNVVMENVTKKTLVKGEDGEAILGADGKRQYTEEIVSQPKTEATKKFLARRVGKDDPAGEGVRVFRVPLDF